MPDKTITKASAPEAVDAYLQRLEHPLVDLAWALRKTILSAHRSIGEEIKWNAPAFFFTGAMTPFNPKEYRRHLVVFNFFRQDAIRLVFWHGDRANDKTGLLTGIYADGRRLATFSTKDELRRHTSTLHAVLKAQLARIHE